MIHKVLIYLLLVVTFAACYLMDVEYHQCPHDKDCKCGDYTIECKCKSNETLILESFPKFVWQEIRVEDCNSVDIKLGLFLHMKLENVIFKNIGTLVIRSFAFSGIAQAGRFLFQDISSLQVSLFGLSGLFDVDSIELVNVTAPYFPEFALSGGNISQLIIRDSRLTLDAFSIIVWEVKEILISGTRFNHLRNASLIMREPGKLSIHNSVFDGCEERSFIVQWAKVLEIVGCTFDIYPNVFIWGDTDVFHFRNNSIGFSQQDAFLRLFVRKNAEFKNNRLMNMEENSLFPHPGNNVSDTIESPIKVSDNVLPCDCRLLWIFNNTKLYSSFIYSSTCYNHKNLKLSQMLNLAHSQETCNFPGFDQKQSIYQNESMFLPNAEPMNHSQNICTSTLNQILLLLSLYILEKIVLCDFCKS